MTSNTSNEALSLLRSANIRDIGDTCFREVVMSLGRLGKSLTKPDRKFLVRTIRKTERENSGTVFCLFSPRWMRGISFILEEQRGSLNPFDTHLLIPYGLNLVRGVDSSRRCEGLLGSDFAYDDLKTWLYEEGQEMALVGEEGNCMVVECTPVSDEYRAFATWERQRTWIDEATGLLHRIEYYKGNTDVPCRRLTIEDYHESDGILIQRRMLMENFEKNHETVIELQRSWHNQAVDEDLFHPKSLKKWKKILEKF